MGPCPSNRGVIQCLFSDSFNTWMWLDQQSVLPPLGGQADSITISGFSGGGSMASDMITIYSDTVKGAGLIASGPYGDGHWTKPEHANQPQNYGEEMARTSI